MDLRRTLRKEKELIHILMDRIGHTFNMEEICISNKVLIVLGLRDKDISTTLRGLDMDL